MAAKTFSPAKSHRERVLIQRRNQKIRDLSLIVGGVVILLAVFWLLLGSAHDQNVIPARAGSSLGDFSLKDIQGKTVRLSDYKGKPVLVNAWATWCPPCKAEMPLLNQYFQAHASDGFMLLAVNAGDSQNEAASFASQNGLAFPVLLDPGAQLLSQLGIHSFPTSILIGRDGIVKSIHLGMFTSDTIETELTPLLKQ